MYAALLARAHFADEGDDAQLAATLRRRAADLKQRFNHDFWLEDHGWLAMGLDRDKQPLDALTSNMGHCLWTGILDEDKAQRVGEQLLSAGMFSGWGIRTLATSMTGYNPISYHNGSVWPHDNAHLRRGAHALRADRRRAPGHGGHRGRGGALREPAPRAVRRSRPRRVLVPGDLSDVVLAAGMGRGVAAAVPPVDVALRSRRPQRQLHLAPEVPEWIGRLVMERVPLMDGHLSFEVDDGVCTVFEAPEGLTIVEKPRGLTG